MDDREHHVAEKYLWLQNTLQRLMSEPGDYRTPVDGLTLYRREEPGVSKGLGWAEPHITVVFQGCELVMTGGGEVLACKARQCRVIGATLLGTGCVESASSDTPFMAVSLRLDQNLITYLTSALPPHLRGGHNCLRKASVDTIDPDILDAFLRLAKLLERPAHIPYLAPLIILEIHYRLLMGPHGETLSSQENAVIQ